MDASLEVPSGENYELSEVPSGENYELSEVPSGENYELSEVPSGENYELSEVPFSALPVHHNTALFGSWPPHYFSTSWFIQLYAF